MTRTREIEEFTNLLVIHPAAARLTPLLARWGVRPNAVSVAGMCCGILAGWAYWHYPDLHWLVAGFLLMLAWHILDGADGQLARLTNSQSEFGKIVDGIADYATFCSVYVGLGLAVSRDSGAWVLGVVAAAGVAHALQAAVYEAQRQEYDFCGWNKQSAEFKTAAVLRSGGPAGPGARQVTGVLGGVYTRMQQLTGAIDPEFRARLSAALIAHAGHAESIRRRYRDVFAPLVRRGSLLSSNYRTIAIFVLSALNIPLWYFLIELLVLTPLAILMVRERRAKCREFARWLDQRDG